MLHYDVVVIGFPGPAGENGAIQAAFSGKKVALIEKEAVPGGASANTGTIPSKALRETALAIKQARSRDAHGIELRVSGTVTIPELMGRRGADLPRASTPASAALNRAGVEQFRGIASFVDPHTIRVTIPDGGAQELGADVVLLAGTRPFHPPQYPIDNVNVCDSDSILLLDRMPRSLAVLGGGVAGCEYASLFAALNVNVKLVDSKDRLLTWLDAELSGAMQDVFKSSGIDLHQRTRAAKLEPGEKDVLVTLEDGGHRRPEGARRLRPNRQRRGAEPVRGGPRGDRARPPQGERAVPDGGAASTRRATSSGSRGSRRCRWNRGASR